MLLKNVKLQEKDRIKYLKFTNLELPGIYTQGITTRIGGVSLAPYDSFNLGYFLGDRDRNVVENRRHMRRTFQLNHTKMITADQIHSNKVSIIAEKITNGGWEDPRRAVRMTDAIITKSPNVTLAITSADCVPILIYDVKQRVAAAVHAGWKGTGLMIAKKTIDQMIKNFNTKPENCYIAMGPSIGICCYTVDIKVIDFYRSKFSYWREIFHLEKNTIGRLNLAEANRRQLLEMRVLDRNIAVSEICTSCNNDLFYSFRRNSTTGRHMAFISLARR